MINVKALLKTEIKENASIEADKITGKTVKLAACRMKPKTSDVSTSYTSDAIINAPDIFFYLIALIYRSWLIHGKVTPANVQGGDERS